MFFEIFLLFATFKIKIHDFFANFRKNFKKLLQLEKKCSKMDGGLLFAFANPKNAGSVL